MEELVRPHSEDALQEYLARMGLSDGRVKQQPLREALRSIVGFCDHDQERLRDDTLLQAIRAIAERALESESDREPS
ncbi:MAG TPA: hypothetical protein VGN51_19285 [Acidimicrobiia bacterium]|jgi:hypothetical protein